jgi:hypothetical protein
MPIAFVLLPLFVEVLLTFGLLFRLAPLRRTEFKNGLRESDIALGQPNWSVQSLQVANSFNNQFQLPVLFYVLTILSIMTRHADLLFVVLAWIFVLTRLGHAFVHVTNNRVMVRGGIYGLGALVLFIAWVIFIVRIVLGLP